MTAAALRLAPQSADVAAARPTVLLPVLVLIGLLVGG